MSDRAVMNEAETRAGHIDPALKAAGWGAADAFADLGRPDEVRRVFVDFQRHLYHQ